MVEIIKARGGTGKKSWMFYPKKMHFILNMMGFILEMMDFTLKMIDFIEAKARSRQGCHRFMGCE